MKTFFLIFLLAASASAKSLVASWYGSECAGKQTASGEIFDPERYTCASWDYPLGTWLRVARGNKGVYVLVTDRGPNKRLLGTRQIDLSRAAFESLGKLSAGLISVEVSEVK